MGECYSTENSPGPQDQICQDCRQIDQLSDCEVAVKCAKDLDGAVIKPAVHQTTCKPSGREGKDESFRQSITATTNKHYDEN